MSSIQQGTKQSTRYEYDNNGNVIEINDRANNTQYNYEYDLVGRLIRSFVTKNSANYLTTQVSYDDFNRVSAQKYILSDGTSQNYSYTYRKDNLVNTVTLPYSRKISYNYDSLNRPIAKTIIGDAAAVNESYTYLSASGASNTTSLVSKVTYSGGKSLQYSYNALNNITAVKDEAGKQTTYQYDGLGQLIRENNPYSSETYIYTYDKGGNITSVKTYAYTTSSTLGTPTSTNTYTYGDSTWKDKLTNYNGTAITYDAIGNPLKYRNGTLSWQNGRQLATFVNASGLTTAYTYNADGVRVGKSGWKNVTYTVSGSQILSETSGGETIYYIYDDNGLPIGLKYKGNVYTYRKNLQGDIIGILDSTGKEVVYYRYNAWGVVTSTGGSMVSTVGASNPFRYRGYYYDFESGYYYLNSRYYDPTTGRFINADNVLSGTGESVQGYNLYAYCFNDPVNMSDHTGNWPEWLESVAKVVSVAVAVVAVVTTVAAVSAFTAGTGSAAAVYGATVFLGAALSGINGGVANEAKGNSYINGYIGGATGGAIQAVCSKTPGGTVLGGGVGVAVGTAVTDVMNNLDPDSSDSTIEEIAENAIVSGGKALITSSVTAYVSYASNTAVNNGAYGLMPSYTFGFGEGVKAFFGWADDALVYIWE